MAEATAAWFAHLSLYHCARGQANLSEATYATGSAVRRYLGRPYGRRPDIKTYCYMLSQIRSLPGQVNWWSLIRQYYRGALALGAAIGNSTLESGCPVVRL